MSSGLVLKAAQTVGSTGPAHEHHKYGPAAGCPKRREVIRGDSMNQTLPFSRASRNATRDLSEMTRHEIAWSVLRRERRASADNATAQDVQGRMPGSSGSMVPQRAMSQVLMSLLLHGETFLCK